jgi:hypothetical protein
LAEPQKLVVVGVGRQQDGLERPEADVEVEVLLLKSSRHFPVALGRLEGSINRWVESVVVAAAAAAVVAEVGIVAAAAVAVVAAFLVAWKCLHGEEG